MGGNRHTFLRALVCTLIRYVAPEIITKQKYGAAVDIWSMGVIFYILLCGYPPFLADTRAALFRCIIKGKYKFHEDAWGVVSDQAKDFISKMLIVDPTERWTSGQLLRHPWLQEKSLTTQNLMNSLKNLKAFNARRRLRRAFHAVRAAEKLKRASIDISFQKENLTKLREEVQEMGGQSKYVQSISMAEDEAAADGVAVAARVGRYGAGAGAGAGAGNGAGGAGAGGVITVSHSGDGTADSTA